MSLDLKVHKFTSENFENHEVRITTDPKDNTRHLGVYLASNGERLFQCMIDSELTEAQLDILSENILNGFGRIVELPS